jgi:hypothetical protein
VRDWRRLLNEERHNLYFSPNAIMVVITKGMRWAGQCSTHGKDEKCIHNFGLKT